MNGLTTTSHPGVVVPESQVIDRAINYARGTSEPYLFNHVMRARIFAVRLGQLEYASTSFC
jgi:hypothetical protein